MKEKGSVGAPFRHCSEKSRNTYFYMYDMIKIATRGEIFSGLI